MVGGVRTANSVSYTHLDVYKRQAVTYATQKIIRQSNVTERSLVTTCRLLNSEVTDIKRENDKVYVTVNGKTEEFDKLIICTPVSYTHLSLAAA